MPWIQIGFLVMAWALSPDASTITIAPSTCSAVSRIPSGADSGGPLSTSFRVSSAPKEASGLRSAFRRFLTTTAAHSSRVVPVSNR